MTRRAAVIKQADAKRLLKAVKDAGFNEARLIVHPDGRIETCASIAEVLPSGEAGNSWDDVLR